MSTPIKFVLPAVDALRSESARVGWPLRFATDLDHDERFIREVISDEPFAWVLYADGTHIAPIEDRSTGRTGRALLTCAMVADTFGEDACRYYVWDGCTLIQCRTSRAADEALAHEAREWATERARARLWSQESDGECAPDCY